MSASLKGSGVPLFDISFTIATAVPKLILWPTLTYNLLLIA